MAIKKGTTVKQIVTPIVGTVAAFSVDQETGEVQYLVDYQAGDEVKQRYFKDSEIEVVEAQ